MPHMRSTGFLPTMECRRVVGLRAAGSAAMATLLIVVACGSTTPANPGKPGTPQAQADRRVRAQDNPHFWDFVEKNGFTSTKGDYVFGIDPAKPMGQPSISSGGTEEAGFDLFRGHFSTVTISWSPRDVESLESLYVREKKRIRGLQQKAHPRDTVALPPGSDSKPTSVELGALPGVQGRSRILVRASAGESVYEYHTTFIRGTYRDYRLQLVFCLDDPASRPDRLRIQRAESEALPKALFVIWAIKNTDPDTGAMHLETGPGFL
jgi:hypothetical protein